MQTGVAPAPVAASRCDAGGIPVSAQAQTPIAAKKGGWNSGHTFAVCAVAAVAIILAVVSFAEKGPVETVAQVNAPSASSQNSPLGSPQVAAPAPAASVPDDLMKAGTASDPSSASPVPGAEARQRADEASGGSVKTSTPVASVAVSAPGAKVNVSPNGAVQVSAGGASVSVPAQERAAKYAGDERGRKWTSWSIASINFPPRGGD